MMTAQARLSERHREVEDQEDKRRRWEIYKKATAARDALAAEFKELYPAIEGRVADLLTRVVVGTNTHVYEIHGRDVGWGIGEVAQTRAQFDIRRAARPISDHLAIGSNDGAGPTLAYLQYAA